MNDRNHGQTRTSTDSGVGLLFGDLTYKLIGCGIEVRKELGLGFLEKVYENALMVLMRREGLHAVQQAPIEVLFLGEKVGHYVADILVEDTLILEVKAGERIVDEHRAQVINYLKATGLSKALLINFGAPSLQHKRFIFTHTPSA